MAEREKGTNLKKVISSLESNRKNVESGVDIPENIKSARGNFAEFEAVIKGQVGTIATLKSFEKSMNSQNARNLEAKKFFYGFADRMRDEVSRLMKTVEGSFQSASHKSSWSEEFKKASAEVSKMMVSLREESDTSEKMYSSVMKLQSIRDNIICQFLRAMLYRKNVLWRDLNIRFDDYIHGEVKLSLNKIKENEEKYGFVPSTLEFRVPKPEISEQALPDLLEITIHDYDEMIESMKNFSKLSEEPQLIEDISKNQHVVKGLRDKIELLTKNYNSLMEKYRSLQISKGKSQVGATEEKSLSDRIEELESLLMKKEQDILELRQNNMKSDSMMQGLKDKNKELEEEISKWQNFQLPKIKELELNQRTLLEEFHKAKKDFETYTNLYQTEREDKIKAYSDLKEERNRLTSMATILGAERRKIKELKSEINRKEAIIMELVEKAPDP